MQTFGQYLTSLRQSRRLRQIDLARLAIVDDSYIASLERDRRVPPRTDSLKKLLVALKATHEETIILERTARVSRLVHFLNSNHQDTEGVDLLLQIAKSIPNLVRSNKLLALEEEVTAFIAQLPEEDVGFYANALVDGEAQVQRRFCESDGVRSRAT